MHNKDDETKNKLSLFKPENVTLLQGPKKSTSNFLLDKERLNVFIKSLELDQTLKETDTATLTKRCTGMKILMNLTKKYSDKMDFLLGTELKNNLIGIMMLECSSKGGSKEVIPFDWLEQRLYLLKKKATESINTLKKESLAMIKFNKQMLSLSKPLESSIKETYSMCVELSAAMNYGKVDPAIDFRVIEYANLKTTRYHPENAVIVDPSECDTTAKLKDIFQHVEVIITSDIDIKGLHEQFKELDKKTAYLKTIVLIDKMDITKMKEVLSGDINVTSPSTDDMDLDETVIAEMTTFCGFKKEELNEFMKGTEGLPLSKKIQKLAESLKKEENKKDNKKEEGKAEAKDVSKEEVKTHGKEEDKKEGDNQDDDNDEDASFQQTPYNTEYDYTQLYGLQNDEKFEKKINELAAYDSNNYSLDENKEKEEKLNFFSKVYKDISGDLEVEYLETLTKYYKQMCKENVSQFIEELKINDILKLVLSTSRNLKKFAKYILREGQEAVTSYLSSAEETEIKIFYQQSIIRGNLDILTKAIQNGISDPMTLYQSEKVGSSSLSVKEVPKIINLFKSTYSELLYSNPVDFCDLITMMFMIPLAFREERELQKQIYTCIYKLILPVCKNPDAYNSELTKGLLKLRIFQKMIDKINYDITVTGGNRLTPEQKLLFEIFVLIHKLDAYLAD